MEIAEFSLKREGFLLEKARNGKEAFEIFKNSKEDEFSAVIMDIMMPEMDGLEATKKSWRCREAMQKKFRLLQ